MFNPKILIMAIACMVLAGILPIHFASAAEPQANPKGQVVIANRGSGSISVIDVQTDAINTIALPAGANTPEPMYVVYVKAHQRVLVGDRANNRVVAFSATDFSVQGTAPAGAGIFHMWANESGKQLWVANDMDNTVTVIDPKKLEVITTVPMPADLVALGGKPHDVIVSPHNEGSAFVTMLGFSGDNDYVVKFDTTTFAETARAMVGKDPHLSLTKRNDLLYVPAQNSNIVSVLHRSDLSSVTEISVPGAHGAGMRDDGKVFYTTNLSGGGSSGLVAIDTEGNSVMGAVNTPFAVPHNIALTSKGAKIYVTHSGPTADKVSIYSAEDSAATPELLGSVTVGLNPFGLAYVP